MSLSTVRNGPPIPLPLDAALISSTRGRHFGNSSSLQKSQCKSCFSGSAFSRAIWTSTSSRISTTAGTLAAAVGVGSDGAGGYQYNGDEGKRLVQVGPERAVQMGDPASAFFDNLPAAGGGATNMTAILQDLATALEADTDSQDTLTDLSTAMEAVTTVQARIGTRINAVDDQYGTNETAILSLETNRSTLEDLDFAEAITRLELQLTALQAAQQSFVKIQGLSLFNYL